MSLKDQLIKLGSENPELRDHLKPVLDHLTKQAGVRVPKAIQQFMVRKPTSWEEIDGRGEDIPESIYREHTDFFRQLEWLEMDDLYDDPSRSTPMSDFDSDPPEVFLLRDSFKPGTWYVVDRGGSPYVRNVAVFPGIYLDYI